MKKPILLALYVLAAYANATSPNKSAPPPVAHASPEVDPVSQFKKIVSSSSQPEQWTKVYLHTISGKWAKQYFVISNVKYDVKKTDSLVTPVMGIVNFTVAITQSDFFTSKEEAEESTALSKLKMTEFVTGKYLFEDGNWRVDQFSYYAAIGDNPPDRTTVTLSREKIIEGQKRAPQQLSPFEKWIR